jgi:hypothetical protein
MAGGPQRERDGQWHTDLEPGGVAVLTTPNYRSLWPLIERAVSVVGAVDYRAQHVNPFTRERLERELAACGFVAIRSRTFFVAAPFLAGLGEGLARWVDRQERRMLPALGAELVVAAQRPLAGPP